MPLRAFTPEQERMLAAEYASGKTFRELAAEFGRSNVSVRRAVIRGGGTPRRNCVRTRWSDDCKVEVVRQYQEGASVRHLARQYCTRSTTISDVLQAAGVQLKPGGRNYRYFRTLEACQEVVKQYHAGESLTSLANKYGCSPPVVAAAIRRTGAEPRRPGVSRTWTAEVIAWVVEQYRAGRSQQDLAEELGVSQSVVSRRLRVAGVTPVRPRPAGPRHGRWKGGRSIDAYGYVSVVVDDSDLPFCIPNSSGRVGEHRLVMGRAIGRPIVSGETVHHINGIRTDNRIENLQLRSGNHGTGVALACNSCGSHDIRAVPLS